MASVDLSRGMEKEKVSSSDRKARGETQPAENGASATGAGKLSKEPGEHDEKGKDSDEVVTTTTTAAESPLAQLMSRTGYSIVQQNGQRRYGPPPTWTGSPPKRGCEVFVGKIPRDCYEDELVPAFEKAGPIYEMRLMMDYNGQNRGYAFVVYCNALDAKESVKILNNYEIRKVSHLVFWAWPVATWGSIVLYSFNGEFSFINNLLNWFLHSLANKL